MQHFNVTPPVVVNARVLGVPSNGQKRVAEEICARLQGITLAQPPASAASGIKGHLWEQLALPRLARGANLWSPSTSGPICHPRHVVTVHDIAFVDAPQWFSRSFATLYDQITRRLSRRALHIVTVSDFTRDRLIAHYGADPARVTRIYSGVSTAFRRMPPDQTRAALARMGIGDAPYLVTFFGHDPRKNMARIVQAWRQVSAQMPQARLVTFGRVSNATVFAQSDVGDVPASVLHVGGVSDDDLACLYSGAAGLAFPSLYEGFGLPVVEAAACGARVLTANTSALPEVSPPDSLLVDPESVGQIAAAMEALLTAPRDDAAAQARVAFAARFDWDQTARDYAALFNRVFA